LTSLFLELRESELDVAEAKLNEQKLELHGIRAAGEFWDRHGSGLTYKLD